MRRCVPLPVAFSRAKKSKAPEPRAPRAKMPSRWARFPIAERRSAKVRCRLRQAAKRSLRGSFSSQVAGARIFIMAVPRFVHLRMHSEFSVTDGIVRIDDAVKAAAAD